MIADDMSWKEIKRKVGEMASMENDLRQAQGARDYWKSRFERMERDLCECYVVLPVDADGVPIHAGDVLDGYGKTIEVVEIQYRRSGWVLISRDGNGYADTFAFTHHHERTVEDVLEEYARRHDLCIQFGYVGEDTPDRLRREYADEIRQMLDD